MSAQPNEPTPAPEATTPAPDAPQEPAAAAPEPPKPSAPQADAKANPWDDPEAAKAEIERLRKENGAARTTAKAQAAEAAKNELAQQIGKALGLIKDDEPADPVKLTEQLTATATEARQAKVALAVYQAAPVAGGDPSALLDSTSFLAKVNSLDPTDTQAVATAIAEAVAANPRLAAVTATPGMKPNPAQGRSASPPASLAERITAAETAGDTKAAIRLKASMALNPDNSF